MDPKAKLLLGFLIYKYQTVPNCLVLQHLANDKLSLGLATFLELLDYFFKLNIYCLVSLMF